MKKKLLKSLLTMVCLVLGIGSAWADNFSKTYSYGLSDWSLTNYTDQSTYYQVPTGTDVTESVATISGLFTGKTITSDVVVTINCGTYGSGGDPTTNTFSLYNSSSCTSAVTSSQGGTLPTSKTYTDVTYTVAQANTTSLTGDLAIKITKPGKTIRLNTIKVEFSYTTGPAKTLQSIAITGTPTKTSYFDGDVLDPTGLVVTGTYDSGDPEVITKGIDWTFDPETLSTGNTSCDVKASVGSVNSDVYTVTGLIVTAVPTYTAHFSVNGVDDHSADFAGREGAAITFPADPSETSGKVFRGWVTSPIDGTTNTAPSFVSKSNETLGTADVTYYAVFATAAAGADSWNQVTTLTNIVEGQYVIKNGDFVLSNELASGSAPAALDAPTVTTGVITGTVADNMIFNLTSTGTDNQFYVKNPDGKNLYATNNNNGLRINTTQDKWTFAVNTTGYFSMKDANNNRYCGKYTDGSDWRSYTSATAANYVNSGKLELYKLTSNTTYSGYCTSFVVVTLTGIEVTGTPDEFWKADDFNHNGMTVTATWSDESNTDVTALAEFSSPDMSTAGQKTITVTYQDETDTYSITVQTIANTQATAYTTGQAKTLIDAAKDLETEVYVTGIVSKVDGYNDTHKSITYWLDGNSFEIYGGLAADGDEFSSADDIEVGATVVVLGKLAKYGSTYEVNSNNHLVSYIAPATATITLNAACTDGDFVYGTYSNTSNWVVPSDLVVSEVCVVDGELAIYSYDEGDVVPANAGVMVAAEAGGDYYVALTNATSTDSPSGGENCLVGTGNGITVAQMAQADTEFFRLTMHNGTKIGFWWGAEDGAAFALGANKAYLAVSTDNLGLNAGSNMRGLWFDDNYTTSIESVQSTNSKAIYDLQGRRVLNAKNGMYIVNGRKVIR